MKFAYTRLVTADMARLRSFYEALLQVPAQGSEDYVEFHPGGAILALVTEQACGYMHGGTWTGGANRSAILEFEVEDVDQEQARIAPLVNQWVQQPKDMPWGNRSMLFRDPEGNAINFFTPSAG